MKSGFASIFVAAVFMVLSPVLGQTTEPAASQPEAAHVAEIPPGYHVLTVGTRHVICLPSDDDWVRKAAESVRPATRPTTMPSDLLAAISEHRADLDAMVQSDLALSDTKDLDEVIDKALAPELAKFDALNPNIYYFPVPRTKLLLLMENGWTDHAITICGLPIRWITPTTWTFPSIIRWTTR